MAGRLKPLPWMDAAKAIMTTDTYPKVATATVDFDGVPVAIAGIAKGSGMIAPDMATMLSFVFTDAPIARDVLQGLLADKTETQLQRHHRRQRHLDLRHAALLCHRQGRDAGRSPRPTDPRAKVFAEALGDVLFELAMLTVRDGEGATKLVTVTVEGAESDQSAWRIARSIANSPLVKTAIAGEDANWGRVVMAVGKAGEPADRDKLSIWFGDNRVAENGERSPSYDEAAASAYMKGEELEIRVDLELGNGHGDRLHLRPHARLHRHQRQLPELIVALPGVLAIETRGPQGLAGHRSRARRQLGPPRRERLHQARQLGAEPRS